MDGTFLEEWRDHYHPMEIYIDAIQSIHITDQVPRLTRVAPTGVLTGRCKPVPIGTHGVWGDSYGDLFLAEVAPWDRVTKLERVRDPSPLSANSYGAEADGGR